MIPKAKQCKPNIFSKVNGRKAFQNSPKSLQQALAKKNDNVNAMNIINTLQSLQESAK